MAAKAGYLATTVGIPWDNGSIWVCVRVMAGLVRARHFSVVFSVHSTLVSDFYDLVVWGSVLLPFIVM